MPHVIIDCSENLFATLQQEQVCQKSYDVMMQSGLFLDIDIKTRMHAATQSYVGKKGYNGSFVHAQIYLLEGRTVGAKKNLIAAMCAMLGHTVPDADSITVDISELQKEFYQKWQRVVGA